MVAGPELARILNDYDAKHSAKRKESDRHHEQIPSIQKAFAADVKNVMDVMDEMGNPFSENSKDLFPLESKVIMSDEVVQAVRTAEELGKSQYKSFITDHITIASTKDFYDTICKNNMPLFKSHSKNPSSKTQTKLTNMKNDVQLFSRMYISCQARDQDLDTFFEHENHAWPPSLDENNIMYHGNKAELLGCLEVLAPWPNETPEVDVSIIDGAALVHTFDPKKSNTVIKTFNDYAQKVIAPHLTRQLQSVTQIHIVWDTYRSDSFKSHTRQSCGVGEPLCVAGNTAIPTNWKSFLHVDSNKKGLFNFLATSMKSVVVPEARCSTPLKRRLFCHLSTI